MNQINTIAEHANLFMTYPRIAEATSNYDALPFENVSDKKIAQNVALLAVVFACDFRYMALKALQHETQYQLEHMTSSEDEQSGFAAVLQLTEEECATDNIHRNKGKRSHLAFMYDAAVETGADVENSGVKRLYQTNGKDMSGLNPELQEFLSSQRQTYQDPDACLATVAYREEVSGTSSGKIIKNLPGDTSFDAYSHFLQVHIDVDGGTEEHEGHGAMMTNALTKRARNLDRAMEAVANFQEKRTDIYRRTLNNEFKIGM